MQYIKKSSTKNICIKFQSTYFNTACKFCTYKNPKIPNFYKKLF